MIGRRLSTLNRVEPAVAADFTARYLAAHVHAPLRSPEGRAWLAGEPDAVATDTIGRVVGVSETAPVSIDAARAEQRAAQDTSALTIGLARVAAAAAMNIAPSEALSGAIFALARDLAGRRFVRWCAPDLVFFWADAEGNPQLALVAIREPPATQPALVAMQFGLLQQVRLVREILAEAGAAAAPPVEPGRFEVLGFLYTFAPDNMASALYTLRPAVAADEILANWVAARLNPAEPGVAHAEYDVFERTARGAVRRLRRTVPQLDLADAVPSEDVAQGWLAEIQPVRELLSAPPS